MSEGTYNNIAVKKEFHILIVDDSKMNVVMLAQLLMPKYIVTTAFSGEEALRTVPLCNPDLILLDVILPDIDGFEVMNRLKKSDATNKIPVIFISNIVNVQAEEKALQLGAVDYIAKPFHVAVMLARIEAQLRIVKQIRTIEQFGLMDELTGIPNRRSFDLQIAVEWGRGLREQENLSLLMLDVDHFKEYNDTYGHLYGDEVLKSVALLLVHVMKRTTDLVFRWGGDEFAVILPNTDLEGAQKVINEIFEKVNETPLPEYPKNEVLAQIHPLSVSIGMSSSLPDSLHNIADFINMADKELYLVKEQKKTKR